MVAGIGTTRLVEDPQRHLHTSLPDSARLGLGTLHALVPSGRVVGHGLTALHATVISPWRARVASTGQRAVHRLARRHPALPRAEHRQRRGGVPGSVEVAEERVDRLPRGRCDG